MTLIEELRQGVAAMQGFRDGLKRGADGIEAMRFKSLTRTQFDRWRRAHVNAIYQGVRVAESMAESVSKLIEQLEQAEGE